MIDYLERPVGASLLSFVECLWRASGHSAKGGSGIQRIVPDGCPELIVQLGNRFERRIDGRWRRQPDLFVAGTLTAPWFLRPGAIVATLGVRFRPGAIRALLPLEMAAARDRETDLAAIVGAPAADALRSALRRSRGDEGRFETLERWLLERCAGRPRPQPSADAVRRIVAARGRCRLDALSGSAASERRALQRRFRRDLGISPKRFARIVRLNALLATLDAGERESTVDLALELGWFDQPHMLRDLRLLAGRKLSTPRAADGELARNFTAPERLRRMLAVAFAEPELSHSSKPRS